MKQFKPKQYGKQSPEHKLQLKIIAMLRNYGWFVKPTHGNMFQSGFPDLFACHSGWGGLTRWIEVKLPEMKGSRFTGAQLEDFPKFCANGSGVWILTDATEAEYKKLFKPPNWFQYLPVWKM